MTVPDRWEHCALSVIVSEHADYSLSYYGTITFSESFNANQWNDAIGQLGQGGWELVSTVTDDNRLSLYFKRRAGQPIIRPLLRF